MDDSCKYDFIEASDLVMAIKCLRYKFQLNIDKKNFEHLCRQILASIDSPKVSQSYINLVLKKDTIVEWIRLTNWIMKQACDYLKTVDPALQQDSRLMNVILTLAINLLTVSRWKVVVAMNNRNLNQQLGKITDIIYTRMLKSDLYKTLKELLLKGVCRQTIHLSQISLNGIMSLILRIFQSPKLMETYLESFIIHVLSVPALVKHMNVMANEIFQNILKDRRCTKIILHLHSEPENQEKIFRQLAPSYSLCIIANIIDLGLLEMDVLANHGSEFCTVLSSLLVKLNQSINETISSSSHYHHIFGWSGVSMDESIQCSMIHLRNQLKLLWSSKMIRSMFDELYDQPILDKDRSESSLNNVNKDTKKLTGPIFKLPRLSTSGNFWKKLHITYKMSSNEPISISQIPISIQSVCMLYFFTTNSLSQIRDDILAGVSLTDLPARMWRLIQSSGSVKQWANIVKDPNSGWYAYPHESHLLHIFVLIARNLFIILDDHEVFEKEKVFTVAEIREMAQFFNHLFIEVATSGISELDLKKLMSNREDEAQMISKTTKDFKGSVDVSTLLRNCHNLLMVLFERDIRHSFVKEGFWLSSSHKVSQFMADLRKDKFVPKFLLKYVPHIIPHKERVVLFHEKIKADRAALGLVFRNWNHDDSPVGAVISVRRVRIVEDGYDQLMKVSPEDFKKKIRVRFINELGMDEVGIDLDGVFKEFLEETLKTLLNPSLNLFCTTSDNRLYPSPLSGLYEQNHLLLFQFLGRMMAKAIYEEILVEAPFANFFLTQVLRKEQSNMYSFIDELNTLDKDLYKSLTYVKHYEEDVSDLELTFSYDEDRLGKIETHDLRPGGRYMTVTNDTKISYVHMVARFRMFQQIRDQTRAFISGFYSIIQRDWFDMFSVPEMLKLICGDTGTIDIDDLKQNVRYSGGFHAGHRVIVWLWDILKNEFCESERSLFLKFVTSCSKPPLLGFAYLEPTFSIRCVLWSDEDQEAADDSVGSLLKHIFTLSKKKNDIKRLPSAATCFNLLKLPNYESKSTLREKLRYVINSGAGFELS